MTQWNVEALGRGYSISSVKDSSAYITFEKMTGSGEQLVGVDLPTPWIIAPVSGQDANVYR
jgi:hypothetical protein